MRRFPHRFDRTTDATPRPKVERRPRRAILKNHGTKIILLVHAVILAVQVVLFGSQLGIMGEQRDLLAQQVHLEELLIEPMIVVEPGEANHPSIARLLNVGTEAVDVRVNLSSVVRAYWTPSPENASQPSKGVDVHIPSILIFPEEASPARTEDSKASVIATVYAPRFWGDFRNLLSPAFPAFREGSPEAVEACGGSVSFERYDLFGVRYINRRGLPGSTIFIAWNLDASLGTPSGYLRLSPEAATGFFDNDQSPSQWIRPLVESGRPVSLYPEKAVMSLCTALQQADAVGDPRLERFLY